jgi:hypothetical protein
MLETDCPVLAPVPFRGKRCEPAYVAQIAAAIAETRGLSLEALSAETREAMIEAVIGQKRTVNSYTPQTKLTIPSWLITE